MVNDYTHKIVIKEDGIQSLIIVPALPKDSGEWTVIAQNRAGRTSVTVTLTVDGGFDCSMWSISKSQANKSFISKQNFKLPLSWLVNESSVAENGGVGRNSDRVQCIIIPLPSNSIVLRSPVTKIKIQFIC